MEIISKNEKDTQKIAESIAKKIQPATLICLFGDLGAGKTTFVKYFCNALKIKDKILSPTFVLERIYSAKKFNVHHYDLYRLTDNNQLDDLQINENLDAGNVCIVEWPELALKTLPKQRVEITILKIDEHSRKFIIKEVL